MGFNIGESGNNIENNILMFNIGEVDNNIERLFFNRIMCSILVTDVLFLHFLK